jgi:hypothetical protein
MAGAVCSLLKMGIDEAEDVKVCINEACLIMLSEKYKTVDIVFDMGSDLTINVCGKGKCEKDILDKSSRELGLVLLNSLIDKVDYKNTDGIISSITLIKRLKNQV